MDALQAQDAPLSVPTKDQQSVLDATHAISRLENGATLREVAAEIGVAHTTVWRWLRTYEAQQESVTKYLALRALQRVEDWETASEKAASKGDHRPAKDWLLHAKAIEPVNEGSQGTSIAIIIGTPEQPLRVQPPQVIDMTQVSE